ncbi:MAG: pepT2 [Akkermansiaceae bacterium]|nr:pepT2 [Akkermansiaceae bacterium]
MSQYRTTAIETEGMPPGIPYIIGNEAAERFSFYGMRGILVVFMTSYLHLMDGSVGKAMSEAQARENFHLFASWVYFTPLIGALIADVFLGKYMTILLLSIVYCLGHAAMACMGTAGMSGWWLFSGLLMITIGGGGIKPCVSAHVGDQFGRKNHHLITKVYNWFYFSINFGSFFSAILTPWLLKYYGPHWAFGVPGVLMVIATIMFWMGRHKFIHIPPSGMQFFRDLASKEGLIAVGKLTPLFLFVAMFWALYDQSGSAWVIQAESLDLHIFGHEVEASQVQSINPIFILTFIPLFTFVVYPLLNRVFPLTPLRKIAMGLVIMVASFAMIVWLQSLIDHGDRPSVWWQILAYAVITVSEVLVSIVGLEFAYTQAPKSMKSMVMSLFWLSVFLGNIFTAEINRFIQIPSAADKQFAAAIASLPKDWKKDARNIVLPGFDGKTGSDDDFVQKMSNGNLGDLTIPGQELYQKAGAAVEALARVNKDKLPAVETVTGLGNDPWGNPIQYKILNSAKYQVLSNGPSKKALDEWNQGIQYEIETNRPNPDTWLEKRKVELKVPVDTSTIGTTYKGSAFSGGQTKLEGAAYYRFFTWLMFGTAIIFIPFAMIYRPKSYLQGEDDDNPLLTHEQ